MSMSTPKDLVCGNIFVKEIAGHVLLQTIVFRCEGKNWMKCLNPDVNFTFLNEAIETDLHVIATCRVATMADIQAHAQGQLNFAHYEGVYFIPQYFSNEHGVRS